MGYHIDPEDKPSMGYAMLAVVAAVVVCLCGGGALWLLFG